MFESIFDSLCSWLLADCIHRVSVNYLMKTNKKNKYKKL